jgi:hypothetical protein
LKYKHAQPGIFMELKIASDTDQKTWDAVVERSSNSTIFHTWKFLRLMEKYSKLKKAGITSSATLYPVMLMNKDSPVGIYPFFLFKPAGLIYCYSPPPLTSTVYLGPLIPDIDEGGKKTDFSCGDAKGDGPVYQKRP